MKNKRLQNEEYKKSLDTQVKCACLSLCMLLTQFVIWEYFLLSIELTKAATKAKV